MPRLNTKKYSPEGERLLKHLSNHIIGQARAVKSIVEALEIYFAGLRLPNKPIATLLFLGPSGVGKTEVVRALAKFLHGDEDAFLRLNGETFQEEHEIAKLIGSPHGYVGFREEPLLTQKKLDRWRKKDSNAPSILLIDELEKAADSLHQLLLGIMDTGKLTLSCGDEVDLTQTIIICTSNLAARETALLLSDSGLGFHAEPEKRQKLDEAIWKTTKEALRKHFRPEFLGRVSKTVVFHSLSGDSMKKILDLRLNELYQRLLMVCPVVLSLTSGARRLILTEGVSNIYGVRELQKAIQRLLIQPLAKLIGTAQIMAGDVLRVGREKKRLTFELLERNTRAAENLLKKREEQSKQTLELSRPHPLDPAYDCRKIPPEAWDPTRPELPQSPDKAPSK